MDLLLISEENKSHCVYIRNFERLNSIKLKIKIKNTFVDILYNVLAVKVF